MDDEKKPITATRLMNEMNWKQMDMFLEQYKKENPEKYERAQKKGEEIMSFDYERPYDYVNEREMKEFGSKIYRDVNYLGMKEEELSKYELDCLKKFLNTDDLSELFNE